MLSATELDGLVVDAVRVHYPGADRPVLDGVSFAAGPGVTALVGASGSGKTTLLRCIAGAQRPDAGTVVLSGGPVEPSPGHADPRVAVVFQDYRLVDFLTVGENLRLARELRALPRDPEASRRVLAAVGLAGFEGRRLETLSGGQLQRVAIARAFVVEPRLLLADEPTGALDRATSDVVAGLLHQLGDGLGVPVLIATHDLAVASGARRVLELPGDGRLHERTRS